MLGEFVRVRDGDVYLRIEGKMVNRPFDQFSKGDKKVIRDLAAEKNLSSELPEPKVEEQLGESRVWEDSQGHSVEGSFDNMPPDGRVLVAGKLRTHVISVYQLSKDDHVHLKTELDGTELASLVPEPKVEPEPVEPGPTVTNSANQNSPKPPSNAVASGAGSRPGNSTVTTIPTPSSGVYEPTPTPAPPQTYESPVTTYDQPHVTYSPRVQNSQQETTRNSAYEVGMNAGIIARYVLIVISVLSAVAGFFRYMFG